MDDGMEIVMDVVVDMDDELFVLKGNECVYVWFVKVKWENSVKYKDEGGIVNEVCRI